MADKVAEFYDIHDYKPAPYTKHVHHGRTPAAWAGSMIALVGFIVCAIGMMMLSVPIVAVSAALFLIAIIATVALQKMGKGAY
ncbi:hypothetical protein MLP_29300 [Microlunatus phosphovorus NM-1]|uniref:Uncharacterized protein n=1 Tax=Microlunatus phosphovorus (strain ATCC 700054 / DSM 10555 / JCM 9379 / NBRC 101784 / NCIMB 13414 / VKM Ac-1990 / NM-1) TaxID=1032480 RepID=F5XJP4_MICPN|nr:HGxxPAAW family protein [Microlunatus phosphovorus]BAK35944.1 hypothetical protein MLP_29300 [Microlunatus phosphovorus NM-1]